MSVNRTPKRRMKSAYIIKGYQCINPAIGHLRFSKRKQTRKDVPP